MPNTTTSEIDSRGFRRRQFIAGTAGAATLSLAGCLTRTSLAARQTFGTPHELTQMDGRERHLVFGDGDNPEVVFTLRQDAVLSTATGPQLEWVPFHVIVHHREGLRADRLTLRLHAPPADGSGFDANVYLRSPATGLAPSITLNRAPDGRTVLDGSDLSKPLAGRSSAPADANIHLYFVVNPLPSHPAEELHVEFDATMSEQRTVGRDSRRAIGRLIFPFVRG